MRFTIIDFIALAIVIGGLIFLRRYSWPKPTQRDNAPRVHAPLTHQDRPAPPSLDSIPPQLLGPGALVAGIVIGAITLSTVKKGMGDCYYVGELTLRTNCVNPLAYYYAPLGLALLLIILGVVSLATRSLKP